MVSSLNGVLEGVAKAFILTETTEITGLKEVGSVKGVVWCFIKRK